MSSLDGQGPDSTTPNEKNITKIPTVLPHERVFPIQVGGEVFKLSGASLSSDAPSYFSQYFRCQLARAEEAGQDPSTAIRTLNIDRDPITFRDIALHLQGYHICPRDGTHFVRLFADAQFYSLPRLMSQLYEESIFISIGHREFQIPREILTDAENSPNFFSLGFGLLFSSKDEVFPGLDRESLIRPPSLLPPSVPNRSADTFAELLRLLQGYPVEIRNETHREDLLRDARYFHFKGLEQRLIPHDISFNPLRGQDEIVLRLENIQKSGISVKHDDDDTNTGDNNEDGADVQRFTGMVNYARPYVDDRPAELVLEIAGQNSKLHFTKDGPRLEFLRDTRTRFTKLLEVIATKLGMPPTTQPLGLLMASGGADSRVATPSTTPLSESDFVKVDISEETSITVNGQEHDASQLDVVNENGAATSSRKRRRTSGGDEGDGLKPWIVNAGQWRLSIQQSTGQGKVECVLQAVQVDAISSEANRNKKRGFLTV